MLRGGLCVLRSVASLGCVMAWRLVRGVRGGKFVQSFLRFRSKLQVPIMRLPPRRACV